MKTSVAQPSSKASGQPYAFVLAVSLCIWAITPVKNIGSRLWLWLAQICGLQQAAVDVETLAASVMEHPVRTQAVGCHQTVETAVEAKTLMTASVPKASAGNKTGSQRNQEAKKISKPPRLPAQRTKLGKVAKPALFEKAEVVPPWLDDRELVIQVVPPENREHLPQDKSESAPPSPPPGLPVPPKLKQDLSEEPFRPFNKHGRNSELPQQQKNSDNDLFNGECRWEFSTRDSEWKRFDQAAERVLEAAKREGKDVVECQARNRQLIHVDLSRMVQLELGSGATRPVRRVPPQKSGTASKIDQRCIRQATESNLLTATVAPRLGQKLVAPQRKSFIGYPKPVSIKLSEALGEVKEDIPTTSDDQLRSYASIVSGSARKFLADCGKNGFQTSSALSVHAPEFVPGRGSSKGVEPESRADIGGVDGGVMEGLNNSWPDQCSTISLRGLPDGLATGGLQDLMEAEGFHGTFDFLLAFQDSSCEGSPSVAIVNFIDPAFSWLFCYVFGEYWMSGFIAPAAFQGLDANKTNWRHYVEWKGSTVEGPSPFSGTGSVDSTVETAGPLFYEQAKPSQWAVSAVNSLLGPVVDYKYCEKDALTPEGEMGSTPYESGNWFWPVGGTSGYTEFCDHSVQNSTWGESYSGVDPTRRGVCSSDHSILSTSPVVAEDIPAHPPGLYQKYGFGLPDRALSDLEQEGLEFGQGTPSTSGRGGTTVSSENESDPGDSQHRPETTTTTPTNFSGR